MLRRDYKKIIRQADWVTGDSGEAEWIDDEKIIHGEIYATAEWGEADYPYMSDESYNKNQWSYDQKNNDDWHRKGSQKLAGLIKLIIKADADSPFFSPEFLRQSIKPRVHDSANADFSKSDYAEFQGEVIELNISEESNYKRRTYTPDEAIGLIIEQAQGQLEESLAKMDKIIFHLELIHQPEEVGEAWQSAVYKFQAIEVDPGGLPKSKKGIY